jgi:hypothetical protein
MRENPMDETRKEALRLRFGRKLRLEFDGARLAGDAGQLAYRDLDGALSLSSSY